MAINNKIKNERILEGHLRMRSFGKFKFIVRTAVLYGFIHYLIWNLVKLGDASFSDVYLSLKGLAVFGYGIICGVLISSLWWWNNENAIREYERLVHNEN
jgi:hypothetical protein